MMAVVALFLAAAPADEPGSVTLPLSQARALFDATPPPPAPLTGAVVGQQLKARATGEALEVTATFLVTVLDGSRWTRLALLELGAGVTVRETSRLDGALVAAQSGQVLFLSRQPGTFPVEVKLDVRGAGSPVRVARLTRGADARDGVLQVEASGPDAALEHGAEVSSREGAWEVRWRAQGQARVAVAAARPPLEPVVQEARAQVVSTVEGRARMTVEYRLAVDREHPLGVRLPEGWALTRLAVNGAGRVVPAGREVLVVVAPRGPGEREAGVELTLERDFGVFHLSGRLALALPGVSWPTSSVEASVHLPGVFEYRRLGGSLEPTDDARWTPPEMPGRALRFRQHLVAAAGPTLELAYAVDLDERYFRVRGTSGGR